MEVQKNLPKLISEQNIEQILEEIDTFIFDCDGVLWCMNDVIGEANDVLNKLRKKGKNILFVTNNSTKNRVTLAEKCRKLGFTANNEETISPSFVIAEFLKNENFDKTVYMVGTEAMASELRLAGLDCVGIGMEETPDEIYELIDSFKPRDDIGAVVVGFDLYFGISKMMKAASYINRPDCLFLATNVDDRLPLKKENVVFPGTGSIVRAIETASGKKAQIFGKPSPLMFNVLANKFKLDPKRTMMIGDRADTDILFGKNCGLKTLLVLSGVTAWEDVKCWSQSTNPHDKNLISDFYLQELGDMNAFLS